MRGTAHPRRRSALAGLVLSATLIIVGTGGAIAREVTAHSRATSDATAMVLQSVTKADLEQNTHGICSGSFTHVIKNIAPADLSSGTIKYLDAAKTCGLKVILSFTAISSGGNVYPGRVPGLVNPVETHTALWGYLSVKEPSWVGINAAEIRQLYTAFKAADPNHPVLALFGDIPNFGKSANPYGSGMADVVMVDWYPVETANGGSSTSGTSYVATGPTHFANVRKVVNAEKPGRPVWVMVQTHKYLKPATHKKQLPTDSLLRRQVREGLAGLGTFGVAFHTWSNTSYNMDQLRNRDMVTWMKRISNEVRAGTFS